MQCPICKQNSKDLTTCDQCGQQMGTISIPQEVPGLAPLNNEVQPNEILSDDTPESSQQAPNAIETNVPEPQTNETEKEVPPEDQQPQQQQPQRDEPKAAVNREQSPKRNKHQIDDSQIGQYAVVDGANNIIARTINLFQSRAETEERAKTFLELTSVLPAFVPEYPESVFLDLQINLSTLERERIVIVSCYDDNLALAAAHLLVDHLRLAKSDQRRMLNCEKVTFFTGQCPTIYAAIEPIDEPNQTIAVAIDATAGSGLPFLDSLLSAVTTSHSLIMNGLRDNKLYLICIADAEAIDLRLRRPRKRFLFSHWRLQFLETVLNLHYPKEAVEMLALIRQQQASGKWSKDETEFCDQIGRYLKNDQLRNELKSRDAIREEPSAKPLFRDDNSVEDTVLYAAAYFTNLKLPEFNRVVSMLLGNRTATVMTTSFEKALDGSTREVNIPREKSLNEIWHEAPDRVRKQCTLTTTRDSGLIAFSDDQSREELRTLLEEEYGFFVANKFHEAISCGLLFDPSDRIAENAIRMLVEMMSSNGEIYGNAWLLRLIDEIEMHFASDDSRSQVPNNGVSEMLSGKTKQHVYRRLSQILLAMLENENLADRVDVTFRELTSARLLSTALELIKGLRVSLDLREFDWLRNVIDQSDQTTGDAAYLYLYNELKKMNVGAYDLLAKLKSWLPAEDREPPSYSLSNRAALRLVMQFSLETTARFRADQYGAWPVRHPLLAAENPHAASKRFNLLAYWLFHPGLEQVFFMINSQENAAHVRGALIAEWAFIIVGPPHTSALSGFAARDLLGLLLRQIIANTSSELRKKYRRELLAYWEDYKDFLLTFSNVFDYLDPQQRRELNWKRNVLKEMLTSFRALQKEL